MSSQIKAATNIMGLTYKVTNELDLILPTGEVLIASEMTAIAKEYAGVNRIHKPLGLLFWTDVKNHKTQNWQLLD